MKLRLISEFGYEDLEDADAFGLKCMYCGVVEDLDNDHNTELTRCGQCDNAVCYDCIEKSNWQNNRRTDSFCPSCLGIKESTEYDDLEDDDEFEESGMGADDAEIEQVTLDMDSTWVDENGIIHDEYGTVEALPDGRTIGQDVSIERITTTENPHMDHLVFGHPQRTYDQDWLVVGINDTYAIGWEIGKDSTWQILTWGQVLDMRRRRKRGVNESYEGLEDADEFGISPEEIKNAVWDLLPEQINNWEKTDDLIDSYLQAGDTDPASIADIVIDTYYEYRHEPGYRIDESAEYDDLEDADEFHDEDIICINCLGDAAEVERTGDVMLTCGGCGNLWCSSCIPGGGIYERTIKASEANRQPEVLNALEFRDGLVGPRMRYGVVVAPDGSTDFRKPQFEPKPFKVRDGHILECPLCGLED